jgi:hypothetical protein
LRRVAIGSCSYHDISMSPYTAKIFNPDATPIPNDWRSAVVEVKGVSPPRGMGAGAP